MFRKALVISRLSSLRNAVKPNTPATVPPPEASSDDDDDDDGGGAQVASPNSNSADQDITAWHCQLAKALLSLHQDVHAIITEFEECTDATLVSTTQYKKTKYELMRIALLLSPEELPTCADRESTDLQTDLTELDRTVQREKHRSILLRIVAKLRNDLVKLRSILPNPSCRNQSLACAQSFRKRTTLYLADIRAYLVAVPNTDETASGDGVIVDDELLAHRKAVSAAIAEINACESLIDQRLADYRSKVKPSVSAETHELITSPAMLKSSSSPFVRRSMYTTAVAITPEDFPDLSCEASVFFDKEPSSIISLHAPVEKHA